MKLAPGGKVKFRTMSLEEPENTDAVGLKKALDNSFQKLNLELEISNVQISKSKWVTINSLFST